SSQALCAQANGGARLASKYSVTEAAAHVYSHEKRDGMIKSQLGERLVSSNVKSLRVNVWSLPMLSLSERLVSSYVKSLGERLVSSYVKSE
ncbi:hypothetical protein Hamer_G026830, partial [Homarus americanus]